MAPKQSKQLQGAPGRDGRLRFQYRAEHDVVIVDVDWRLETEADIQAWIKSYEDHFQRFKRKMDAIFELSHFHVNPRLAARFGEARTMVLERFTNRTYRVNMNSVAKTLMYTSKVLHGGTANDYPSIETALVALFTDRNAS